ncbi:MAG: SCO family protein [Ignavibacteriales bacterium]|nr:SCO family protein [Ignavibacteriales bacterium]
MKKIVLLSLVLTFVYYRCPGICSPLLNELSHMVEKMDLMLGKDYQILTISFDHREKPPIGKEKKANYIASIPRAVDPAGWRFCTADSATVHALTDAAGFYFKRDGNDYIHAGTLIFISPDGKIARYIFGIQYLPFDVTMALVEAGEGKTGPTTARLLNFCYSYQRETRSYAFNIVRVSGMIIVAAAAIFVLVIVLKPRRKSGEPTEERH